MANQASVLPLLYRFLFSMYCGDYWTLYQSTIHNAQYTMHNAQFTKYIKPPLFRLTQFRIY